jgi:hypothetical protein
MSRDEYEIDIESDYCYADYSEPHTLLVHDVQEIAVRRYIYNNIGKTGTFVLHFDDLKYSFPTSMVSGYGCITFRDALIRYEVTPEGTALHSDDREKLVAFVLASLDDHL